GVLRAIGPNLGDQPIARLADGDELFDVDAGSDCCLAQSLVVIGVFASNAHPRDRLTIGRHLAQAALAQTLLDLVFPLTGPVSEALRLGLGVFAPAYPGDDGCGELGVALGVVLRRYAAALDAASFGERAPAAFATAGNEALRCQGVGRVGRHDPGGARLGIG